MRDDALRSIVRSKVDALRSIVLVRASPRSIVVGLVLLVALGAVAPGALGAGASGAFGAVEQGTAAAQAVDGCTTVDEPGRYTLTSDVRNATVDTCIRVTADDVTLDGAGHAVDGVGAFGSAGVLVTAGSNVTVRNVTATDWDDGVRFTGISGATVANTTTARNRVGLSLVSLRNGTSPGRTPWRARSSSARAGTTSCGTRP